VPSRVNVRGYQLKRMRKRIFQIIKIFGGFVRDIKIDKNSIYSIRLSIICFVIRTVNAFKNFTHPILAN